MANQLPKRAQVIVIGGGIAGCSVTYHLGKLGISDVVLLEKNALTSGTTWHAAGLLAQLRASQTQTDLARYSLDLYESLAAETEQATGLRRNGTLMLAQTGERWIELKRRHSEAKSYGLESHLVSPGEASRLWDLLHVDDLVGGLYIPSDGQIDPAGVTQALAKGARRNGAKFFEYVEVTDIRVSNRRVMGVETDAGSIACDAVINCAGMWARALGQMAGATIPLQAVEHMYLITEPMEGLKSGVPSLRDYDGLTYFKEDAGKLVMGGTERKARPWAVDGIPNDFHFALLNEDWDQFQDLIEAAIHRVPALGDVGIRQLLNGPESFTPDGQYILGECLEVEHFYVCAGFNSTGIAASGGAGRALAEWIVEGEPTMDLSGVDVRRFRAFQGTKSYLQSRVSETVSLAFAMHWPFRQPETARGIRRSPLHDKLAGRNACFGEAAGWERPNWFAPNDVQPVYDYAIGRQNWLPYSETEHRCIREQVGLIDVTSFTKFKVQGEDALPLLQSLCTKDLEVPIGTVVYTLMLNRRGGIECDITVTRTDEQTFLIYSGAGAYGRVLGWIRSHIRPNQRVSIIDTTSSEGVIAVMGPESRTLLSRLTSADLSNEAFPFSTSQEIDVTFAMCRASRVTFVGELGWELAIPTEHVAMVYGELVGAGEDLGLADVGYHALDSLRIERGYRHYGSDITSRDTPLEAGLGFVLNFKKNTNFIGLEAMMEQKANGLKRRMAVFQLKDTEPIMFHHEPIWRDGNLVGQITSAAYGHTVGRAVGLGYVACDNGVSREFIESGSYEIEIAAERFPATASLEPPYDAKGIRVRM
ncbi:MAG: FAD-dependent oxidoreductase [Acidobacteria bacterium]|nr:FAD-dependent oxidoreductase [Acidobacteriota bacterium]